MTVKKNQEKVIKFISEYISKHGYAPSFEEIGEGTGYTSRATIHLIVRGLLEEEYLETDVPYSESRLSARAYRIGKRCKEGTKVLTSNIESRPYTGKKYISGRLRVSEAAWLDKYFDSESDAEHVTNVTRGKIYDVIALEGFGDCEDVLFRDDIGEMQRLADFFFEEVKEGE